MARKAAPICSMTSSHSPPRNVIDFVLQPAQLTQHVLMVSPLALAMTIITVVGLGRTLPT